ncbi:hypothetical protein E4U53_002988 [Claviceps sorghi]|nr:hypothetical protein E4U53_002988 [Claviceps sorghi]
MPSKSPSLARFLSDFTLGFSDGLTVPFALTAGLSSLGQTDTVVYAGLAELCAGSISMGIGGYLSARDEVPELRARRVREECSGVGDDGRRDEEERGMLCRRESAGCVRQRSGSTPRCSTSTRESMDADEKDRARQARHEAILRNHLAPLALPDQTTRGILALLGDGPGGLQAPALRVQKHGMRDSMAGNSASPLPAAPVVSGLSISLGYIVGGIIPLLPYLSASTVGQGLRWSTAVCLLALMAFGFGKSWLLGGGHPSWRAGLWEGVQMLVLGAFAAGAAVLCVNLLGRTS